jgi:hypothetical protein
MEVARLCTVTVRETSHNEERPMRDASEDGILALCTAHAGSCVCKSARRATGGVIRRDKPSHISLLSSRLSLLFSLSRDSRVSTKPRHLAFTYGYLGSLRHLHNELTRFAHSISERNGSLTHTFARLLSSVDTLSESVTVCPHWLVPDACARHPFIDSDSNRSPLRATVLERHYPSQRPLPHAAPDFVPLTATATPAHQTFRWLSHRSHHRGLIDPIE